MRKFNWVDGLIIVSVLVIVVGVWSRFHGRVERVTAKPTEFTYQVEALKMRKTTVDALQRSIGMTFNMEDKARTDDMGTLVSVDVRPALKEVEKSDGTTVLAEIPERYDAMMTLNIRGVVNDYGYFTPQLSNLGAGAEVILKSKFVKITGNVVGAYE